MCEICVFVNEADGWILSINEPLNEPLITSTPTSLPLISITKLPGIYAEPVSGKPADSSASSIK